MIADLDEMIRQLLIREMPIKNGEIDVSFDQPKREWSARLTRPTVNFFLYDVRENALLKRHEWERLANNGRAATLKRSPLRVDCHYMVTTWAAEPDDEHRLLTRTLLALFRYPKIPREQYAGKLQNQPYDIISQLARHDKLTNPAEVWSALDNEMRPSVSYILTLALDPWEEIAGPVVRTFRMHVGQGGKPAAGHQFALGAMDGEMVFIAGTVRSTTQDRAPQAGIPVAIKGTGYVDTTDDEGRFRLGSVAPGSYTLVIWPPQGKPREEAITIPADSGNYDIEF